MSQPYNDSLSGAPTSIAPPTSQQGAKSGVSHVADQTQRAVGWKMSSRLRKFALTIHIAVSVGWIGAAVAYLILVLVAMNSQEVQTLRAAWIAMDLIGWYAIVPLGIAALLTGVIMALGTAWGLFKHYWVLASFLLTLIATIILLVHMQPVSVIAGLATATDGAVAPELRAGLQEELAHAGIGLLVLLAIQVLNVYKPRGLTPFGRRKQREQRSASLADNTMA